ncbi:helicase-exonuclease AddAB subunit AddB [Paenibacillus sp. Marseille-Q4541]|uniref:helicase-exonuclease AddAB subunit AddB n=1 Tax=Paenibacillus sp. Marseille-Q4541 TaxID=2831522 RepID=UPI001BA8E33D|nr:helicase-exonuclease AddAB subunit AddB [Paenibacillus sp. Marseille-Q4541]
MPLHLVIGRAGSGKTSSIMKQITDELGQNPGGKPMILIVPEQASFQAETTMIRSPEIKGSIRAQVLNFRRLSYRVMQETSGSALVPVGPEGKKMLLYKIVQRRKDELKIFSASGGQMGFVGHLSNLYAELKRYGAPERAIKDELENAEQLPGAGAILRHKLHDIATIYRDFEAEVSRFHMDEEDTLVKLAEQLSESDYIKDADIWIDGFRSFTPQELAVIKQLIIHARSVTVALTLDRPYGEGEQPQELNLFYQSASAYIKLQGIASELGEATRTTVLAPERSPRYASAALAHLESGFEKRSVMSKEDNDGGVELYSAANSRVEVEGMLREIRRLVREEDVRYRDIAVLVRNMDTYENLISPLFQDYEVPYFHDKRRDELHHPLAEFLRSAMDIVRHRWRYEDVFRAVKTDLLLPLDGSVRRYHMDLLENYVLASGISGYRWTDGKPWKAAPSLSLEEEEGAGAQREEASQQSIRMLETCREIITTPLFAFEKRVKKAKTAREFCTALFLLLQDAGIANKLDALSSEALQAGKPEKAREHRGMWGAVLELLDQVVEMMGDERMDAELFAGIMETGLSELKLGLVPAALDQVLVGSMDRSRTGSVSHVFILGALDGVLPQIQTEDGVLTETERAALTEYGLQLGPDLNRKMQDERFLIYTAFTQPSRKLWISYPLSDEDGKALHPSEMIRYMKRMFPGLKEKLLLDEPAALDSWEHHKAYLTHPDKTMAHLISQLREWRRGNNIPEPWWEVYNWYVNQPELHVRLERMLGSVFYENRTRSLTEATSRKLYGNKLKTSVSRMERFAMCPFSHFASHGLKLRERQVYRLKAPDIGQLFHAALSKMASRLKEHNRNWASLTKEECVQEAEATVDVLAPQLQGEILLSSARYGYIFRKLKNIVSRASVILGEQSRRGNFEPLALELDFGPDKPLPSLTFELASGVVMEIVGRIDRVDVAEGEHGDILLRVIDYKSSQTDLKLHEVFYGLSLQMLTYLDVLLTYAEEWIGTEAQPAGVLYFHVHNPLLPSANAMAQDQAEQELLKRFKMKGLLLADRDVVAKMDNTLDKGYSSILPVAVKADGGFYSSASVATEEQWGVLLGSVRNTIQEIGTRITEGEVAIEPFRMQQETACTFCPFKSVCQFDEGLPGNEFHLIRKPAKQQAWDLFQHEGGGAE